MFTLLSYVIEIILRIKLTTDFRGVITYLCGGDPGEITLPNGSTVNVRQKCLTAGYESCLKTHTCSWSCSQ